MIARMIAWCYSSLIFLSFFMGHAMGDPTFDPPQMNYTVIILCDSGIEAISNCRGKSPAVEIWVQLCPNAGSSGGYPNYCTLQGYPNMIRENIDTGEMVILKDRDTEQTQWLRIFDYCIPPGRYRYGFESKVVCTGEYYTEVTIKGTDDPCTVERNTPKKFNGTLPWPKSGPNWYDECEDEGGCSLLSGHRSVIALQLVGVAMGVLLLVLRRRRERRLAGRGPGRSPG